MVDPVIFSIGGLDIRWYSVIYLLGFVILYLGLRYFAVKRWLELNKEDTEKFLIYSILGIVIGSRLFYFVFYNPSDILDLLKIWQGGLSFHGGLIGFLFSTALFAKYNKVNFLRLINVSALFGILALGFGRIGNMINGRLIGTAFEGSWCVVFHLVDNVCRHPYPIYAMLSHFLLFNYLLLLIYLNKEDIKEFLGKITITAHFFIGYGFLRILTDIWKVDNLFLGIKTGQWLSIIMVVIGFTLLFYGKELHKGSKM